MLPEKLDSKKGIEEFNRLPFSENSLSEKLAGYSCSITTTLQQLHEQKGLHKSSVSSWC
jgi:hypothetical protein